MERQQNSQEVQKRYYWMKQGLSVREGMKMHRVFGQLEKGPDSWRNVPQHCLVQVPRVGILGEWIGLPQDLIADMKMAADLHDYRKKQEIAAIKQAEANGSSTVRAVSEWSEESNRLLQEAGFNERTIIHAGSQGGQAFELLETKTILDKTNLDPEDLAYLVCHYVDDCSVGSDWVRPSYIDENGYRANIIDYRSEENKAKPAYRKISEEIGEELRGSSFEGINNHDAMAIVSHMIEQRLAQVITQVTGEVVDPLQLPELIDQKIREAIENRPS